MASTKQNKTKRAYQKRGSTTAGTPSKIDKGHVNSIKSSGGRRK